MRDESRFKDPDIEAELAVDDLDDESAAGWRLAQPVDTGYAHLVREQA